MEAWRNELYHFGIMGMKWGVRRYQNPDGSLTPAGRSRYGVSGSTGSSKRRHARSGSSAKKRKKVEDISKLSDQELRNKINRMQMERQYKSLSPDSSSDKVNKVLKKIGNAAIMSVGTAIAVKTLSGGASAVGAGFKAGTTTTMKALKAARTEAYFRMLARRMH